MLSGAGAAVRGAFGDLVGRLGGAPDVLFLSASVGYDCVRVMGALAVVAPGVALHGSTSCLGAMTERGFHSVDGRGGAYGVGCASLGGDPRAAAALAADAALDRARRAGEVPALAWVTSTPGTEEEVIRGLEDVFGPNVPVFGGSAADNTVAGEWCVFADGGAHRDAVLVTVLFPSSRVGYAFHSGYEPTDRRGRVTRAEGRVLHEIDGRPAGMVYDEWSGGLVTDALGEGGNVLGLTTLRPLGRVVGESGGIPYFRLSHPNHVLADGSIALFTDVDEGDELILMRGTEASIISRAGRVAASAVQAQLGSTEDAAGALVIYCAGCMLTVQDRMDDVVAETRDALGGKPFLGAFTFGEQGCFVGGENRHGNLMIATLVFGS
jgi:hypothetical protein